MVLCYSIDFNAEPNVPSWGIACALEEASGPKVDLPSDYFGTEINMAVLQEVVYWQMSKKRSGTANTKLIGEISATKRKPWKQKGTGRARHGNLAGPQFRGGAVVFGPRPRNHGYSINKKVRRKAMRMLLSYKATMGLMAIVSGKPIDSIKTSLFIEKLRDYTGFCGTGSLIYCVRDYDKELFLSSRNIPNIRVVSVAALNVRDIMASDLLLLDENALEGIVRRIVT